MLPPPAHRMPLAQRSPPHLSLPYLSLPHRSPSRPRQAPKRRMPLPVLNPALREPRPTSKCRPEPPPEPPEPPPEPPERPAESRQGRPVPAE